MARAITGVATHQGGLVRSGHLFIPIFAIQIHVIPPLLRGIIIQMCCPHGLPVIIHGPRRRHVGRSVAARHRGRRHRPAVKFLHHPVQQGSLPNRIPRHGVRLEWRCCLVGRFWLVWLVWLICGGITVCLWLHKGTAGGARLRLLMVPAAGGDRGLTRLV